MSQRMAISEDEAQRMMQKQQADADRADAMTEQRESMLRAFLAPEARERLKRIEQVKPERARQVEMQLINAVRGGKLQPPVGDDMVRQLLASVAEGGEGSGKTTNITFARKRMDDDW